MADDLPDVPTRVWVIQTLEKENGFQACLDEEYKVSGDDFYFNQDKKVILPLGTISIQETASAPGYTLQGYLMDAFGEILSRDGEAFVTQIKAEEEQVRIKGGNVYTASNTPLNGKVKIKKYASDKKTSLEGVQFVLTDSSGKVVAEGTTNKDGELLFENLYPDQYMLKETDTVAGDSLLKEAIEFSIPVKISEAEKEANHIDESKCVYNKNEDTYYAYELTYEITNDNQFTLPLTGKTGDSESMKILLIAAAFLIIGFCSLKRPGKS
jgi:hypothetical protein